MGFSPSAAMVTLRATYVGTQVLGQMSDGKFARKRLPHMHMTP